jgi:hypothetical protein
MSSRKGELTNLCGCSNAKDDVPHPDQLYPKGFRTNNNQSHRTGVRLDRVQIVHDDRYVKWWINKYGKAEAVKIARGFVRDAPNEAAPS